VRVWIMPSSNLFTKVYWSRLTKGDIIFDSIDLNETRQVVKKARKIVKLLNLATQETEWVTRLKLEKREYYFLEKH